MYYMTISSAECAGRVRYRGEAMFDALDDTVVALIIGLVAGLAVAWVRSVVAGLVAFAVATGSPSCSCLPSSGSSVHR
jgi:hypothetical protein